MKMKMETMENKSKRNFWPFKIHCSQLPVNMNLKPDKDGFLHGYLVFSDRDHTAAFMDDVVLFECSRPVVIAQTHILIKYSAVVFTGYDKKHNRIGQLCELTFIFNNI